MSKREIITCDFCGDGMPWSEVNAGSYGVDFHLPCFRKMNAAQLAYILGIDDIRVYATPQSVDNNDGVKLNSYIRRNMNADLNKGLAKRVNA